MKKIQKNLSGIIVFLMIIVMAFCLAGCKDKTKTSRPDMDALRSAEVGSYIYFGEYEQDNDESTGKEAIEWLVLDSQEDKMLVISRYALDCQPYSTNPKDVSWETCTLRSWLNKTFYETAFVPEEQNNIMDSLVTAVSNPYYETPAGNDTTDKVFLLSIDETNLYFTDDNTGACQGTPYCYAQDAYKADNGNCWWWLRSPGLDTASAAIVDGDGDVRSYGRDVSHVDSAIRPTMWIDLKP